MYTIISVSIICITFILSLIISSATIVRPYLNRLNDLKEKQIKNELYRLYTDIDPDAVQENVNNLVDNKLTDYIAVNIRTRESMYMNSQDIDTMIKNVSADIYINLSDMYITLIKMIYNINSDEDLIVYINNIVKMRSIPIIVNNNKPI